MDSEWFWQDSVQTGNNSVRELPNHVPIHPRWSFSKKVQLFVSEYNADTGEAALTVAMAGTSAYLFLCSAIDENTLRSKFAAHFGPSAETHWKRSIGKIGFRPSFLLLILGVPVVLTVSSLII